jgi:hypothetical protein
MKITTTLTSFLKSKWGTVKAGIPTFIYFFSGSALAYEAKNQSIQL